MNNLKYIQDITCSVTQEHTSIKTVVVSFYVIYSFFLGGISEETLTALMVLIIFDFVLGVWDAKKHKKNLTANHCKRTPIKILVYYMMIASGHIAEYGLAEAIKYIDETILAFLLLTELISVMKHFGNLGYKTPAKLINNLRSHIGENDSKLKEK